MSNFTADFDKKITPLIDKMYIMYQFIEMSKDDFYAFVKDGLLSYTFDEERETSFRDFYMNAIVEVIHQYIKDTLENNDYRILINFINTIWADTDFKSSISYKKALSGLKRLDAFLDNLDFTLETGEITNLISTNQKLQAVLKTIADKDKDSIASSDFSRYDGITKMLVEAYSVESGLASQDEVDGISDVDLDLDDEALFSTSEVDVNGDEEEDFSWEDEDKVANVRVVSAGDWSNMEYYYQLMKENPVLKPDEEKALVEQMKAGSSAAKDKLVYSNLRLVIFVAKKHMGRGVPFDDLVQEGLIGLMNGIERFDSTRNIKLSTYATWWVRQAIQRYVDDHGRNVRIPVYMVEKLGKLEQTIRMLTVEYGRSPHIDEIARKMKLDESKVLELYSYRKDTISLNRRVDDDESTEFGDFVADPKEGFEEAHLSFSMMEFIELAKDAGLKEKELDILIRHFSDDRVTLEVLGREYGVSRERIRQIEARALEKIARCKRAEALAVYTDNPEASLEFLRKCQKKGPVKSNDTKSYRNRESKTTKGAVQVNGETVITDDNSSVVENGAKEKRKRCSKTATIFERVGISPEDYYQYIDPQLAEYDKSIIEKKYGKDLENPDFSLELTRAEKYAFNTTVLYRVKSLAVKAGLVDDSHQTKENGVIQGEKSSSPMVSVAVPLADIKGSHGELENVVLADKKNDIAQDSADVLNKSSVREEIDSQRKKEENMAKQKKKTIFECLGVSVEDYYQYIEPQLTEKDKSMIVARYGEDLEHPDQSITFSKKQRDAFYSNVLVRMKRIAVREGLIENCSKKEEREKKRPGRKDSKNIFELIGISSADYYQYIEPKLTEKDKILINLRYEEGLEHPAKSLNFSKKQKTDFYCGVVPKMRRIAVREGLIGQEVETSFESDAPSAIAPIPERDDTTAVAACMETGNDGPTLCEKDEKALVEVADSPSLKLTNGNVTFSSNTEDSEACSLGIIDESISGTVVAEPSADENTAIVKSQIGESTVTKQEDTVLATPIKSVDTVFTPVIDNSNSTKERLSSMSEQDLDAYLQFLAGECIEIEKRIHEKRNKLDEAISLYERREKLLARERQLDSEIASKLNNLHTGKEKELKK